MKKSFFSKGLMVAALAATMVAPTAQAKEYAPIMIPVAGGGDGGAFLTLAESIGDSISSVLQKYNVTGKGIETAGSLENIDLINDGDVPVAVLQGDAGDMAMDNGTLPPGIKIKRGHMEEIVWLFNKKNGFKDAEDIEGSKTDLIVVTDGSGALATLENWVREDSGYQANLDNVILADSDWDAADIAATGMYNRNGTNYKVAGMLLVTRTAASSNFADIVSDFGKELSIGSLGDGDFNDAVDVNGDKIYETVVIDTKKIKNKIGQVDSFGGQKTLGVRSMVVYNPKWVSDHIEDSKQRKKVRSGINRGIVAVTKTLH